jgi:transposase-like protein
MLAEERLRLIQDYTEFVRLESRRLGKKFRKSKAVREFCGEEGISPATLYRYIQRYQQGGGAKPLSRNMASEKAKARSSRRSSLSSKRPLSQAKGILEIW